MNEIHTRLFQASHLATFKMADIVSVHHLPSASLNLCWHVTHETLKSNIDWLGRDRKGRRDKATISKWRLGGTRLVHAFLKATASLFSTKRDWKAADKFFLDNGKTHSMMAASECEGRILVMILLVIPIKKQTLTWQLTELNRFNRCEYRINWRQNLYRTSTSWYWQFTAIAVWILLKLMAVIAIVTEHTVHYWPSNPDQHMRGFYVFDVVLSNRMRKHNLAFCGPYHFLQQWILWILCWFFFN